MNAKLETPDRRTMPFPWLTPADIAKRSSAKPDLRDIVVVMPTYAGPELMTRSCIDVWRSLGIDVVESYGLSDVSLHRNIAFGLALQFLESERGKGKTVVLLLDGDIVASPQTVDLICSLAFLSEVAIAAGYCKRGSPTELAYEYCARVVNVQGLPCLEVRGGLGFMAVPAKQFKALCAAEMTCQVDDQMPFPLLCESSSKDGVWYSDDFSFCERLSRFCSILMAPIQVGHVSRVALQPSPDASFVNRDV